MQNSGFLDQRFALYSVTIIAAFGGNPTKVTIFGESACGELVKQLLAYPPQPVPFHGAIMESQASFFLGCGSVSYQQTINNFNCDTATFPIVYLRKISGDRYQGLHYLSTCKACGRGGLHIRPQIQAGQR
jgi:hypothetical protein